MTKKCKVKRDRYKLLVCNVISYMMRICQLHSRDSFFKCGWKKQKTKTSTKNKNPTLPTILQPVFHNLNRNSLTNTTFRNFNEQKYTATCNSRFMCPKDLFSWEVTASRNRFPFLLIFRSWILTLLNFWHLVSQI